jgi:hypothetical protein
LEASVMIHLDEPVEPESSWYELFRALGRATRDLLAPDRHRLGVIPGVKGTLA